jgi:hypothetical protein
MVNRMKKMGRISTGISNTSRTLLGKNVSRAISGAATNQVKMAGYIPAFKKGGTVKKTGLARLHKGELVLTASAHKALKNIMKK